MKSWERRFRLTQLGMLWSLLGKNLRSIEKKSFNPERGSQCLCNCSHWWKREPKFTHCRCKINMIFNDPFKHPHSLLAIILVFNSLLGIGAGLRDGYLKSLDSFLLVASQALSLRGLLYSSMLLNHTNPKLSAVELKLALLWSVPLALELNFAYSYHLIQSLSPSFARCSPSLPLPSHAK